MAQTSIWHIFFKEGKGVSLGLFHKWHPDVIKDNTQLSSPNAECDGYPLKKRENNVATFLIFFWHLYLIIGTYFSHFRGTWWFLWSIKILCSPQVVLSNRGLHFVKILWLIYRKTINIPQKPLFFQKNVGYVATHGHISKIWLIIGLIQGNKYYVTQLTLDITAQTHGYWVILPKSKNRPNPFSQG